MRVIFTKHKCSAGVCVAASICLYPYSIDIGELEMSIFFTSMMLSIFCCTSICITTFVAIYNPADTNIFQTFELYCLVYLSLFFAQLQNTMSGIFVYCHIVS